MGIRLEFVLIIAVIGIISASFLLELADTPESSKTFTKEAEFTDTTLIEVDTEHMKNRIYATYGIIDNGVLTLDNVVFQDGNLQSVYGNESRLEGDMLYLDGDVVLQEKGGYRYETQHAVYNKKTEILNITAPFIGVKDKNVVKGESLEYDMRNKKVYGTTVGTIFYTPDK